MPPSLSSSSLQTLFSFHTGNRLDIPPPRPSLDPVPQSIQTPESARLSLQSSEWAPPAPSPTSKCCPAPFGSRGGHTRLRERGWGEPIRTKGRIICYISHCCGSGSGIRCLFDPWIRDPGSRMGRKSAFGSGIRDPG